MARVAGRSITMSWIAGIVCTGIVLSLVWLSMPIMPVLASFVGDTLRSVLP
ncbi:hypothetical protein [Microbacterium sp. NPDC089695]|uniref:hypothetical protein n=1 Tax=Microbacterium sp. NPDC089695 TaxID=3364198 RepID=UPI0037F466CD